MYFHVLNAFQTVSFPIPRTSPIHVDTSRRRRDISNTKRSVFQDELPEQTQNVKTPQEEEEEQQQQQQQQPTRIYFDISIENKPIGRLIFHISPQSSLFLPQQTQNIVKLCRGDLQAIHPKCSYLKCRFKHSPQFVEGYPQYRWAHTLDTTGGPQVMNAVGKLNERLSFDPNRLRSCTHKIYGGVYYGLKHNDSFDNSSNGVVLTVPMVGKDRGTAGFSIVRVGESPQEWRERLLLNSAVLGYLEEGMTDDDDTILNKELVSGIDVLHFMARQTRAPPLIIGCGTI